MKKLIIFLSIVILIIIGYIIIFNKRISYNLEYVVNDFKVEEFFDKDTNYYKFLVYDEDNTFEFLLDKKYSTKRSLVNNVILDENDSSRCITISVEGKTLPAICKNSKGYSDAYIGGIKEKSNSSRINTVNKIDIYDKSGNYYIWNGHGITNVLTSKKYNFIDKETYDNSISYQLSPYILFANYDETREFTKFYIFNEDDKKVSTLKLETPISFDSYFNGHIGDDIYIFDKKNKVQYKINISKSKVTQVSTSDYAISYDGEKDEVKLSDFIYSNKIFTYDNYINYFIKDKKLYYKYYGSDYNILIDDSEIKDILYVDNDKVYYLVGTKVYSYDLYNGAKLLLDNFEWNFSYNNKIFIF